MKDQSHLLGKNSLQTQAWTRPLVESQLSKMGHHDITWHGETGHDTVKLKISDPSEAFNQPGADGMPWDSALAISFSFSSPLFQSLSLDNPLWSHPRNLSWPNCWVVEWRMEKYCWGPDVVPWVWILATSLISWLLFAAMVISWSLLAI